jgi:tetratricopeptide (TPR) repeat protein
VNVTSAARFAADTSQVEGTLVVLEGSVELRDGDVTKTLGAGSRFDLFAVELAKPEGQVTRAAPAVERVSQPGPLEPKPAPEKVVVSVKPRAPSPPPLVEPAVIVLPARWTEWVAEGKTIDVLEQALPRLEEVLREQDAPVLLALADAARFQRRDDLAERTCETILQRFPDTAQAATARFTLGRLAEQRGAVAQALAHYEAYDVEAPGGALAAEAVARRVQLESARGAGVRACDLAKSYVTRFPAGPLAQAFRQRCVR